MPAEVDYQPAISFGGHAWRLAFVLATSAVVWIGVQRDGGFDGRVWLLVVDLLAGLVAFVAVLFRRRRPVPATVVASALTAVSATAGGPAALAMMSLGTRRDLRAVAWAAAVNVTAGFFYVVVVSSSEVTEVDQLFGVVVPVAAFAGWGLYIGSNRALVAGLRWRAERAEAEQALRQSEARAVERTRIAREMHDVVAHRISQVSMRAGALAFRGDLSADQMRAESEVIRDAANDALRDLRGVLEVLRDPVSGLLIEGPQPTWVDVATLIGDARASGATIEFADATTAPIPAGLGRTLYRVVQEGITNATRHAPGTRLRIELVDQQVGVALTMTNRLGFAAAASPGAGLGLVGLAERVALADGRFERERRDGEFRVRVWLPRPAETRSAPTDDATATPPAGGYRGDR